MKQVASVVLLLCLAESAFPLESAVKYTELREPCSDFEPLRKPLFGDTHVHTTYSFDANSQDTRTTPLEAYRFARGDALPLQPYDSEGNAMRSARLERPLHFAAVTDHAEFLGEVHICTTPGSEGYWHPVCMAHRYAPALSQVTFGAYGMLKRQRWGFCGDSWRQCYQRGEQVWAMIRDDAETAYDRSEDCRFTSFVGYEFTGTVGQGDNLHRNVLFRNDRVPARPRSWIETETVSELWQALQSDCVDALPGCDALTIPHNSNISGGLMFESPHMRNSKSLQPELTKEDALRRARWEPLVEVMQHKGSSECDTRAGWENDRFCGFEKLDYNNFGGKKTGSRANMLYSAIDYLALRSPVILPGEKNYIRWALKEGLRQQADIGANSFRYGMISSTDTHISAPGLTAEIGHPGHGGAGTGARDGVSAGFADDIEYGPGGLAVVWAEENSRTAIFEAMQRREVYSTSGTRPILRFFGGWSYEDNLCGSTTMIADAYGDGVPMGGELSKLDKEAVPKFLAAALMDSGTGTDAGKPLQRVQIIKGWHKDGQTFEKVIDVAGGDNDAGVDTNTCETYGNGHQQLCALWQDPDFDPGEPAFYYARVIENPTCRWSQHVCVAAKVDCTHPDLVPEALAGCCAENHEAVIQERAISSPIWYTPAE